MSCLYEAYPRPSIWVRVRSRVLRLGMAVLGGSDVLEARQPNKGYAAKY